MLLRKLKGFTLIEMMVVIVIISILAAVATASYRSYIVKARRTSAQEELLQIQQIVEEFYALNHTYQNAYSTTTKEQYTYALVLPGTSGGFSGYRLTATAQPGQASSDAECAVLYINRNGTRGGGKTGSLTEGNCW